jgi:hypothetical protein
MRLLPANYGVSFLTRIRLYLLIALAICSLAVVARFVFYDEHQATFKACLNHTFAPDAVIWERTAEGIRTASSPPECWRKLQPYSNTASQDVVVFLHGLETPGGETRLCAVVLDNFGEIPAFWGRSIDNFAAKDLKGTLTLPFPIECGARSHVLVHAGTCDPKDRSRLCFVVEIDGKVKTIEGRLGSDRKLAFAEVK